MADQATIKTVAKTAVPNSEISVPANSGAPLSTPPFSSEALSLGPTETIEDLLARVKAYDPSADLGLIEKAYHFSEKAHAGQFRRSGEPYVIHPLSVAGILAELKLDSATVITGLLHDTV